MAIRLAVLTGDVIDSRRIDDARRLRRVLDAVLTRLADRHDGAYQRYRGDGFQLALGRADAALDAAMALRAALIANSDADRRWDARLAIAVGRDRWRPGHELASADGPVFVASGQALDTLDEGDAHLSLNLTDGPIEPCQTLLLRYLDALVDGWSPYAAEIVGLRLEHDETQQALAKRLGIRQPSVHKRLRAARWPLVADTLTHFRERLAQEAPTP
ncbi:hypothetical protein [Halomonas organivorans]|uniref:DNA-directed RNA polymerase specialized sigma24 family protein n=1 Tax=Halomonas organivorans TaxID=257772 RepID=A0A7W5BVR5_9GAMM|nr:hypothetical protein [Halomonas organivorans]MBB3139979.1 DNA-directed RNA polymerase specialized sigma24 family protein [Halomonas organivorans]